MLCCVTANAEGVLLLILNLDEGKERMQLMHSTCPSQVPKPPETSFCKSQAGFQPFL